MQGRKDQKHGSETRDTVSEKLDELALTRKLKIHRGKDAWKITHGHSTVIDPKSTARSIR